MKINEKTSTEALNIKIHISGSAPGGAFVFFWHEYGENGFFSNWFRRKFTANGVKYRHVEQYMMAEKARLFGDEETLDAILRASDPAECKRLGRLVKGFDHEVWDGAKFGIVKAGSLAKYSQNPDLKEALLKTGEALLAEASPLDRIWGIGLGAEAAASVPVSEWPGENLLGRALMEVRAELKETDSPRGLVLRTMTYENVQALIEFNRLCFPKDYWKEEDWHELLEDPRAVYYAFVDGEKLAGSVFIYNWQGEADYVKIMNLSVSPEYRGMGLAHRLLDHVAETYKALGMKRFCGETRSDNFAMQKVFEDCGYHLNKIEEDYYSDPPGSAYKYVLEL